jgi:expansin (peptidoglycan-binding protein)
VRCSTLAWLVVLGIAACGGKPGDAMDDAGKTSDGGGSGGESCSVAAPAGETGQATYYDADGTGACSFAATTDFLIAAMNETDYGNATWCGGCVDVTGPNGDVVVRIVDECPGCSQGSLDLSETAFGMIAPLSAGRVDISWVQVDCPVTGPIAYSFQSGSSQFYTAIQVDNTRYPLVGMAAVDGAGSAQPIERQSYNYFVASSGLGPGPYTLQVTDNRGQTLEDTGVALDTSDAQNGAAQFASCQ